MNEPISSRKITLEECMERLGKNPVTKVSFQMEITPDDMVWEDTMLLPIPMPRLFWKVLYGCVEDSNLTIAEIASEFLSDALWELFIKDSNGVPRNMMKEL